MSSLSIFFCARRRIGWGKEPLCLEKRGGGGTGVDRGGKRGGAGGGGGLCRGRGGEGLNELAAGMDGEAKGGGPRQRFGGKGAIKKEPAE